MLGGIGCRGPAPRQRKNDYVGLQQKSAASNINEIATAEFYLN